MPSFKEINMPNYKGSFKISKELKELLSTDQDEISKPQLIQRLWAHIHCHKLFLDPEIPEDTEDSDYLEETDNIVVLGRWLTWTCDENGKNPRVTGEELVDPKKPHVSYYWVYPDKHMVPIFGTEKIRGYGMMRYLKDHIGDTLKDVNQATGTCNMEGRIDTQTTSLSSTSRWPRSFPFPRPEHPLHLSQSPQRSMSFIFLEELLEMVLILLPSQDLKSALLVCKSWRDVGERSKFWSWVCLEVTQRNLALMPQVLGIKRLKSIEKLQVKAVSKELMLAIDMHPGLKILDARHCTLSSIESSLLSRVVHYIRIMVTPELTPKIQIPKTVSSV